MPALGTSERPLRVAIVGSGPSGFYTADDLFKSDKIVEVSMFDRLPAPFGLVRYGVAPDHAKIKNVTKVYEKIADQDGFKFYGNVEIGNDISVEELKNYFDAIVFCSGAETDRNLGIHGEGLQGSHAATEFVAWYNGHPDFQNRNFDLSHEVAVVIGQGNVAMDVCRILCKTVDELKETDITQNALDALAESKIKEVHMIGRRGPVQAAFTPIEIREFGELSHCHPVINPDDLKLNEISTQELADPANAVRKKNYDILQKLSQLPQDKEKKFFVHFRKSPIEIVGKGRVQKIILEKNKLVGEPNKQRSQGTGEKEELDCGIVFRSVGYRGVPIKGLPFHEQWGIIPNIEGRVADSEHDFVGLYTAGWIKRGPSGIIGTNKPDAEETIKHLLADVEHLNPCAQPDTSALDEFLKEKGIRFISFEDWKKIDAAEIERGQKQGKPREKFINVEQMLAVLHH
jgi:ferredoxin--NADP+ reductase